MIGERQGELLGQRGEREGCRTWDLGLGNIRDGVGGERGGRGRARRAVRAFVGYTPLVRVKGRNGGRGA